MVITRLRIDAADDDLTELRLWIVDGVAADDHVPTTFGDGSSAAQNIGEQLERQGLARPSGDVQRDEGSPAHGVDVTGRVGSGDLSPHERVVHQWCEEVERQNEGVVVREPNDRCVVGLVQADEDVGVCRLGAEVAEDLAEVDHAELARAAGAV